MGSNVTCDKLRAFAWRLWYGSRGADLGAEWCAFNGRVLADFYVSVRGQPGSVGLLQVRLEHVASSCRSVGLEVRNVSKFRMPGVGSGGSTLMICGSCNLLHVVPEPDAAVPAECPWCGVRVSVLACEGGHTWGRCKACRSGQAPFEADLATL